MFKDEIEKILDRGLHRIATTVSRGLFASKLAAAKSAVAAANDVIAALDGNGYGHLRELAFHQLGEAIEHEYDVLDARSDCYWDVYVGEGPYR